MITLITLYSKIREFSLRLSYFLLKRTLPEVAASKMSRSSAEALKNDPKPSDETLQRALAR